ncbi:unnamed protein product [Amoebophrya sp. A25]|nr:unnamed protein product [Amoebophrya sp. A25]|eukprot:GSA25T00022358001.1
MIGIREKEKTVVVIRSSALQATSGARPEALVQIEQILTEADLEVVSRKQLCLSGKDGKTYGMDEGGLVDVCLLQHMDGDTVRRAFEPLRVCDVYCAKSKWEALRDQEFFFPCLAGCSVERTLAVIKPGVTSDVVEYVTNSLMQAGLLMVVQKNVTLTKEQAAELSASAEEQEYLTSGASMVCLLEGPGAVDRWRLLAGPETKAEFGAAVNTIRGNFAQSDVENVVHCSASAAKAKSELACLFPEGMMSHMERTLCLLKPEAVPECAAIELAFKKAGFAVTKKEALVLTEVRAEAFLTQNSNHLNAAQRKAKIRHFTSGTLVAFVLTRVGAVETLKQLVGPEQPKVAESISGDLLRAKYGRDALRNGFYCSDTAKISSIDVPFFFPELGMFNFPSESQVTDYFYRKTAVADMQLPDIGNSVLLDTTVQQFVSEGLLELARIRHVGADAITFLANYLRENNPNRAKIVPESVLSGATDFGEGKTEYVKLGTGMTAEGELFEVEVPEKAKYDVMEIDVRDEETTGKKVSSAEFDRTPLVVFVCGGPGSGKGTNCARIAAEFNYCHLSAGDLLRQEIAAQTRRGMELQGLMAEGKLVSDEITIDLLKNAMLANQDKCGFLVDGFPRSVEQAVKFEKNVAECNMVLNFDCSDAVMTERILERGKTSGRADDNPETIKKRLDTFYSQTKPVVDYYRHMGRLRSVNADGAVAEVYNTTKKIFLSKFVYLVGAAGARIADGIGSFCDASGYAHIDARAIYKKFIVSAPPGKELEVERVKQALADRKLDLVPSLCCPLIVSAVKEKQLQGCMSFVFTDFPRTEEQKAFLESQICSYSSAVVLDYERRSAVELGISAGLTQAQVETDDRELNGEAMGKLLASISNVQRVPMELARVASSELPRALKMQTAEAIKKALRPKMTLCIGPPGCHQRAFCKAWADRLASATPVDVDEVLDKELERQTDTGVLMHNMLSKGQVIPLTTTFALLSKLARFGCDSLIVENLPTNADEIRYLAEEFDISAVFSLIPQGEDSHNHWMTQFLEKKKGEGHALMDYEIMFSDRMENLTLVHNTFSAGGEVNVYPLDITIQTTAEEVVDLALAALKAKYVLLTGVPVSGVKEVAAGLAAKYSQICTCTAEDIGFVPGTETSKFIESLSSFFHAHAKAGVTFVLAGLPVNSEQALALIENFGAPLAAYYFKGSKDVLWARAEAQNSALEEPLSLDAESWGAEFEAQEPILDGILDCLAEKTGATGGTLYKTLEADVEDYATKYVETCSEKFVKKCVLLVAPSGKDLPAVVGTYLANKIPDVKLCDMGNLVSSASSLLSPALAEKFAGELCRVSQGLSAPSAALCGALLTATAEKNACTTLILTNYLSLCGGSYPSVRDLMDTLVGVMELQKIVYCKFQNADGSVMAEALSELAEPEDLTPTFQAVEYLAANCSDLLVECVPDMETDFESTHYAARITAALSL